jgi:peptide/nickel transport system permease protein
MIAQIGRRLAQLLPVLLIASVGIWGMIYAVPGGPVGGVVGENATPEQIAAVTQRLGLDRPILAQ